MSKKEEELMDVRDGEGLSDRYGNNCIKVGEQYTLHTNLNGTFIISKKIPSFRYLRVRSYKNKEEAFDLYSSLEKDADNNRVVEEKEMKQEDKDKITMIRGKLLRDEKLTTEEFEFLEMSRN